MHDYAVDYYCGLDVGKNRDPSAFAIIERPWATRDYDGLGKPCDIPIPEEEIRYNVVHLERLPLGMSYPRQAELVRDRVRAIPIRGKGPVDGYRKARVVLSVDRTGIGDAAWDLLKETGLEPFGIFIHGGDKVTHEGHDYRVPKKDLVTLVKVMQQRRRLEGSPQLPEWATFLRELQTFDYKINDAGHTSYGAWRENSHDDLLLAVSIALWSAKEELSGFEPLPLDLQEEIQNFRGI